MPNRTSLQSVTELITQALSADERVSGVFLTGSIANSTPTPFSDIEMWVVFSEETGINTFSKELFNIFKKIGHLLGMYQCTAHHFFIIYTNGIQIDLNLITAAQYWSLTQAKLRKKVLFDRQLTLEGRHKNRTAARKKKIEHLLLIGSTSAERAISKYIRQDYYVVTRFLDSIRTNALLPLISLFESIGTVNAVHLELERLSGPTRDLFVLSYAKPTQESCREALSAAVQLMQTFANQASAQNFSSRLELIREQLRTYYNIQPIVIIDDKDGNKK